MENNDINNQAKPIEKKSDNKEDKSSRKYETIKEAMDRGLSYEESLFGD